MLRKHGFKETQLCGGLRDIKRGLNKIIDDDCSSWLPEALKRVIDQIDLRLTSFQEITRAAQ